MQKAQRESGIELLRIICMLMIVVLHAYTYGGVALKKADRTFLLRNILQDLPKALLRH